ncbi:hypothetical protein [Streptomyces sp. SID12488]|uniref:hypothetical protein n=1 Tax=Streptomyces sp. SID12488 TaxID=2706040 RepID=UPI0013D95638|nr:hypothetical protein [Streptomyces sp. SID12488]NEA61149.1 hypothetical protein [Streptomyces sp. SID12488]
MRRLIRKLADWAQILAPAGRHRAVCLPLPGPPQTLQVPRPRNAIAETVRAWYQPIDGAATALVRPYLTAYECDERAHLQRRGLDALGHTTYGVVPDPQVIHGRLGAV